MSDRSVVHLPATLHAVGASCIDELHRRELHCEVLDGTDWRRGAKLASSSAAACSAAAQRGPRLMFRFRRRKYCGSVILVNPMPIIGCAASLQSAKITTWKLDNNG